MTTLTQYRSRARRAKKKAKAMNEWMREADVRTIYEDKKFILFYHRGAFTPTALQEVVGLQRMYQAHEVWVYNPIDKTFLAYKHKGIGTGLLSLLSKSGIKVQSTIANQPTEDGQLLEFASDEDHFLFKLKYGL